MSKNLKAILSGAVALILSAACIFCPAIIAGSPSAASASTGSSNVVDSSTLTSEYDISVSKRDASGEYDAQEAVTLLPDDDLTITEAGVYILSGNYENTMIVVDVSKEDKVQLVLANANLSNANGPAIYVRSADKVFITAAAGTVNTISDGTSYTLTDDDTTLDAAVFSKEDLTINGAGSLTISGNYKHAVVSKDDLVITAKNLTVNAVNVGLNGKDSVRISEADIRITAGTDGIRAENGSEEGKGFVSVADSNVTVVSGKDGIQAETAFIAENSTITVTAGGGSSARSSDASESYKGIKAGTSIFINGGVYQINALDDAIHANGSAVISAGEFALQSRDDGLHANETVTILGGTLNISAYEGIESTYVLISDGNITIQASDDGINAGRKSSYSTPTVEITGGTVNITMSAGDTDGIDANGNIIISGGTISVNGNSAFDYDGTASFTGGTVYVNGSRVTTLPNQMMGGGGRNNFGGYGGGMNGNGGNQGGYGGSQGGYGGGGFGGNGGRGGWH